MEEADEYGRTDGRDREEEKSAGVMAVMRDLALLEAEGRLHRVRCGATAFPSARFEDGADWMTWRLAQQQAAA
ncbi:hypothetical protein ACFXKR_26160 [Streptomyces violascens]|uniref:hypothetical protein n=1 Tax=Streptomyces violascens TaxID=67381 RepID=UPI0036A14358